jgi:hypothetical protein
LWSRIGGLLIVAREPSARIPSVYSYFAVWQESVLLGFIGSAFVLSILVE